LSWDHEKFKTRFMEYDKTLDFGNHCENYLKKKVFADICKNSIHYPDGKDYKLICYCIRSNHIHLISDLRNKSNEISKLANDSNEPIYVTKNGEGDLVVMATNHYSKMQLKLDLLSKLSIAQKQKSAGDTGNSLKQVMSKIRTMINEQK